MNALGRESCSWFLTTLDEAGVGMLKELVFKLDFQVYHLLAVQPLATCDQEQLWMQANIQLLIY